MRALWLGIACAACAGEIKDERSYTDPSLIYKCDSVASVPTDILEPKCGDCHGPADLEGDLDLLSPGVEHRLYGVESSRCKGEVLIDLDNIFWGVLYDKVSNDEPRCGKAMPYDEEPLTDAELQCLHLWLAGLAPKEVAP
jgi:hypothetical protein